MEHINLPDILPQSVKDLLQPLHKFLTVYDENTDLETFEKSYKATYALPKDVADALDLSILHSAEVKYQFTIPGNGTTVFLELRF